MGIYDRNYMGDVDDSLGTAGHRRVTAIGLLIGINVLVWVLWQMGGSNPGLMAFLQEHFTVGRPGVTGGYIHTLLTAMVSHQNLMHIFWNMLFFWFMGGDVQVFYGSKNMVWLYVFCGLVASVAHIAMESHVPGLGASGAVMGITIAAAFIDPEKPVSIFYVPIRLKYLAIIYVVMDLIGSGNRNSGIGHFAHLGGALGGFLFWKFDLRLFASRGRSSSGILYQIKMWWRARRFRVVPPRQDAPPEEFEEPAGVASRRRNDREATRTHSRRTSTVDPATSRRVDELLVKIKREGLSALSDEERGFLRESSEKYKKK